MSLSSTTAGSVSMWRKSNASSSTAGSLTVSNVRSNTSIKSVKHKKAVTPARLGTKTNSPTSSVVGDHTPTTMPSFWSIWATRRIARQLTGRLKSRVRVVETDRMPRSEPTYRLEPHRLFNSSHVDKVIGYVLDAHLHDFNNYDPKRCSALSRIIGEEVKDRVKTLKFDRYKIVVTATMGEKLSQDLRVTSRCMWDAKRDTSSTCNWENGNAFCSVTVYAIYHE